MSRIALIGENSIEYISNLLDIWDHGDCAVLLDWRIPIQTAIEMMNEADVRKCYIEKRFIDNINIAIPTHIEFVAFERLSHSAEILPEYIYKKFKDNYGKEEAVVIYSSGTTGKAKGIILSHFAIHTNADSIISYMKPTPQDCLYMVKTISHASSLVGELLVALKTKVKIVIAPIIVPPRYTMANISKYKVTIMCINPTLLQMYMDEYSRRKDKYDISSLKQMYVHGAKTNIRCCESAAQIFTTCSVYYEYGLTEAGPRVTTQRISSKSIDSVGKPIENVQVKIINQNKKEVAKNEYGIIHVKTPSIYAGYIFGNSKFESLCEGWLNTGDIGYFDDYEELHIVGRADDVMIINAHKIYPSEIEKQILEHASAKECAVAKVDFNGNEFIGCLYVSEEEIEHDIKEKLRTNLLPYEIPRFFLRSKEIPRTNNGKISHHEVQACLKKYINQE